MKVWRVFIANLLVVLLLTTGSRVVVAQAASGAPEANDVAKITAEEEREAREVAERFMRRMQETNDLTPLVGEMFVPDYAARLRQEASGARLPMLSKEAVAQASREELARYQQALNHSFYMGILLHLAYQNAHPEKAVDEEARGLEYFKQVLPPDIVELCMNDPTLRVLLEEETNEGAEADQPGAPVENADEEDDEPRPVRSVEQLRSFTSTMEQFIVLARKHLAASTRKQTFIERHKGANEEENWQAERKAVTASAWTLNREFYGYPKGTRIFCVHVLVYHMDLVRVDGRLKVLALYPDMEPPPCAPLAN
ncbi:MAG TPA: hypothetical protein VGB76_04180 [Pyrinomonadaceae bacterium]